jgi:hypothetical protein
MAVSKTKYCVSEPKYTLITFLETLFFPLLMELWFKSLSTYGKYKKKSAHTSQLCNLSTYIHFLMGKALQVWSCSWSVSDTCIELHAGHYIVPQLKQLSHQTSQQRPGFHPSSVEHNMALRQDFLRVSWHSYQLSFNQRSDSVITCNWHNWPSRCTVSPHPKSNAGHLTGLWVWSSSWNKLTSYIAFIFSKFWTTVT